MKSSKMKDSMQKLLALGVLVILIIFFAIFGEKFFSPKSVTNIFEASYYIGFLAIGVTFVIITGGIDLSLGTVMICGALIGGMAYEKWNFPILAALAVVVVVCTLFGFLNGVMVSKWKLPPFIATLGTQMIANGFGAVVTKVQTMHYPTVGTEDSWFKDIFYSSGGFPIGILWLAGFAVLGFILLQKTRFGRYTFALGSNEEAARLSGVNVDKWKILIYSIGGIFVGMGGIMYAATFSSIMPSQGAGIELMAIAGVVIGGTSLSGGIGSITGTMIGVFLMSVLKQGLLSMGLTGQWQVLFTGIVVIGAVMLDNYMRKKASQVKKTA